MGNFPEFLNEMSKIALDHGGKIDRHIGDAIMICAGDPELRGVRQDLGTPEGFSAGTASGLLPPDPGYRRPSRPRRSLRPLRTVDTRFRRVKSCDH